MRNDIKLSSKRLNEKFKYNDNVQLNFAINAEMQKHHYTFM